MHAVLHLFHLAGACGTTTGPFPSLYDHLTCSADGTPQITSIAEGLVVVGNAVRILIALSGALAVVMIIIAGIMYTTSAGDAGRVKTAKNTLTYAIGGLLLVSMAYALVTFIVTGF